MDEKKLRNEVRALSVELVALQKRLHDAGLVKTAHAVNAASKELGWEAAQLLEKREKTR